MRKRVSKGNPSGGQFLPYARAESAEKLDEPGSDEQTEWVQLAFDFGEDHTASSSD